MASRTAVRKPATYDDLLAVPEPFVAEILDGELHVSPRPAIPHAIAASRLGAELGGPFDAGRNGPGGWLILDEPELHFGEDVVVPDLAGWRVETLPEMPTGAFITIAPDWACEVLSPATEGIDRGKKLALYAREGVRHLWFVNPVATTLEVYRLQDQRWLVANTFAGDHVVNAEPFDAVPLDLSRLWSMRAQPAVATKPLPKPESR